MLERLLSLLIEKERFFITTHIRPDGDALGSQLALGHFLKKLGKEVAMINSDPPPYNLDWLPEIDSIEIFDGSMSQRQRIGEADAILILDTNAIERLGKLSGPVKGSSAVKVLIDHHTNPENWFDLKFARENASSTGELVYEIIAGHDAGHIDTIIATALYTAIMTDTGSFRYSHVRPQLHRVVADLLERGDITPAPIHTAIYDTRSMQSLRLLGRALESITLMYGDQIGYVVVSQRILRDTGASSDDTGGFVNYVLSVEGVRAAVLFFETDTGTKMSFRSKGDAYVNEWARAFGGGGHRNASGAYLTRPLAEAIDMVMAAAPRYIRLEEEASEGELSPEDMSYLSSLLEMKNR
jgi:bifunctional oligoribonuclease and PAP phosphatase NrnA